MRGCVDGCIVESSVNGATGLFLVKGYLHPIEGYIAVPYGRGPLCFGGGGHWEGWRFIPCISRYAFILKINNIIKYFDPWRVYALRSKDLPEQIRRFIEILGPNKAGLTGSWAIGCETPEESDVDIILYGNPVNIKKKLLYLFKKGLIKQCNIDRIISKRKERTDIGIDELHIAGSLTESCFNGTSYTLRIITRTAPLPCEQTQPLQWSMGRVEIRGYLTTQSYASDITVPARYRIEPLDHSVRNTIIILETWRTRYQSLKPGEYIIRGDAFLARNGSLTIVSPDINGCICRTSWENGNGYELM
ncbi:MAG: hypothetical protein LRS48_04775 [Desulfurococcales archaeon]|nr:hypothetical protein [Desulfurococcales archaeon]